MNEFLYKEYEECFAQLRFYDERQLSLLKFSITISSSVSAGILALHGIFGAVDGVFWLAVSLICGVVCLGLFLVFVSMVQNRLYYIYPVRQVNSLRKFLIESESKDFLAKNQMYLNTDFSAFKWRSTQTLMIGGVALLVSSFAGFAIFSYWEFLQIDVIKAVISGVLIGMVFLVVSTLVAGRYLINSSNLGADKSVHEK
ncbi:MAG: hypothetical protein KAJ18_10845 [Candidatus Omnitrophica bacterium]|nr:hypothetical protein [Candidatus Omnitrophota bacterium]